jgi:two-component system chemotaxis response regulator CheY
MNTHTPILLVDDNRAWLETLADYLNGRGFPVLTATDAAGGLALLNQHEVALVVCDYHMPDMDGLEFIRHLRHQRSQVIILMISSEDERTLAKRALAEGAHAYLTKSTAPRVLLRAVRQMVERATNLHQLLPWQRLLPSPSRASWRHRLSFRPVRR